MEQGCMGKPYPDGETIIRQGEPGACMYVIQSGRVEVLREENGRTVRLALLAEGDFFGEMAVFDKQERSATVRAVGEARILTIDKKTLMRRVQEDPSLAYRLIQSLSHRVRELDAETARLRTTRGERKERVVGPAPAEDVPPAHAAGGIRPRPEPVD